jgi:hypothetical protein
VLEGENPRVAVEKKSSSHVVVQYNKSHIHCIKLNDNQVAIIAYTDGKDTHTKSEILYNNLLHGIIIVNKDNIENLGDILQNQFVDHQIIREYLQPQNLSKSFCPINQVVKVCRQQLNHDEVILDTLHQKQMGTTDTIKASNNNSDNEVAQETHPSCCPTSDTLYIIGLFIVGAAGVTLTVTASHNLIQQGFGYGAIALTCLGIICLLLKKRYNKNAEHLPLSDKADNVANNVCLLARNKF